MKVSFVAPDDLKVSSSSDDKEDDDDEELVSPIESRAFSASASFFILFSSSVSTYLYGIAKRVNAIAAIPYTIESGRNN